MILEFFGVLSLNLVSAPKAETNLSLFFCFDRIYAKCPQTQRL